jgi:hypothetical protein
LHTRTLAALTIGLTTAGLTIVGVSRHSAAAPATTTTAGILLVIAALPPLAAAARRRTADLCGAAYNDGYRCGIRHAASGILTPTISATRVDPDYGRHTE